MVEDEWQADHGAGDSKKQDSGCQDWTQVACSTHGMLSQRGYPVCVLEAVTGRILGLPALANCTYSCGSEYFNFCQYFKIIK